ncbi:hypothetical protein PGTUg99_012815 [Puccinia graminis f. sp. tritici]|nr:hypothetical protein PGTUg99_012815 [Puccinia graminis f. sp. tritici]
MSSQSMRATREDGTWPGPSGSSTTGPADRTQLFKPKPIRTAERRFSKTIKKISLANPKSRGSAFTEYGPSLSQPEKDRSNSPIILDSQHDMLNSQHTPQEFIQPDPTTHDAPTAGNPIAIDHPREDQEPATSQPPVVPQIVVPSSKDPQKHLDAGESQPSIIPPTVKPVKEKTKKHQRPKKVKKLVLLSELISPSVEPPSIASSSVESPSIAPSSVEPPSVEPPSIAPSSVVLPPAVRPSIAPPPVAPSSIVPPSVAPPSMVQPSMVPPSMVPSSIVPPSVAPSSIVPPSVAPPSIVPPSMVQPSMVPPSMVPPSMVPPSMVPPSIVPSSIVQPSMVPPSMVPLSMVPPSMVPSSIVLPSFTAPPFIPPPFFMQTSRNLNRDQRTKKMKMHFDPIVMPLKQNIPKYQWYDNSRVSVFPPFVVPASHNHPQTNRDAERIPPQAVPVNSIPASGMPKNDQHSQKLKMPVLQSAAVPENHASKKTLEAQQFQRESIQAPLAPAVGEKTEKRKRPKNMQAPSPVPSPQATPSSVAQPSVISAPVFPPPGARPPVVDPPVIAPPGHAPPVARPPIYSPSFFIPMINKFSKDQRNEKLKMPFIHPNFMPVSQNDKDKWGKNNQVLPSVVAPGRTFIEQTLQATKQPEKTRSSAVVSASDEAQQSQQAKKLKLSVIPPPFIPPPSYNRPAINNVKKDQRAEKLKMPFGTRVNPRDSMPVSKNSKKDKWDKRLKMSVLPSVTVPVNHDPKKNMDTETIQRQIVTPGMPIREIPKKDLKAKILETQVVTSQASRQTSHLSSKVSELENLSGNSHSSVPLVRAQDAYAYYSHQALSWFPKEVNPKAARGSNTLARLFLNSIGDLKVMDTLARMHGSKRIMIPFTYDLIAKDWRKGNWTRTKTLWELFWKKFDEAAENASEEEVLMAFLWISDYISETVIPSLDGFYTYEQRIRQCALHLNSRQAALLKYMSIGTAKIYQMKPDYADEAAEKIFRSFLSDRARSGFGNLEQPALSHLHKFVLRKLDGIAEEIIEKGCSPEERVGKMPRIISGSDKADPVLFFMGNERSSIGGYSKQTLVETSDLDPLLRALTDMVFTTYQHQQEFMFQPERIQRFFFERNLYARSN